MENSTILGQMQPMDGISLSSTRLKFRNYIRRRGQLGIELSKC